MGLAEATVFPEIDLERLEGHTVGLNITMSFSGGSDAATRALLEELGFPFVREEVPARG
jgi:ribosomal protein L5